jgi:hypothetical protein
MKNKRGLSTVVASLMMILLTLVLVGILWGVLSNLMDNNLPENCVNTFDKVTINEEYTCYNRTGNYDELRFSINVGDISVNELLISISGNQQKKTVKVGNVGTSFINLRLANGTYNSLITIPQTNEGRTYVYNLSNSSFSGKPDKIEIAPIILGEQCGVSDTTTDIIYCSSLN